MSDTRVKDPQHLEQLKAQLLDRIGHDSRAETLEDLVVDVERISRFVIVPEDFQAMLRDIAAFSERHGAGSLQTSLKVQGADPAWAELIAEMDELTDFDKLRVEVSKLVGRPFKSKLFTTLLKEIKRVRRAARVPDEFIEGLEGIIAKHEEGAAVERAAAAEAAKMAGIEGADEGFTKRLVALARGEGLDVRESRDVMHLMARLRRLGNVHINVRHKLEPFEAELRGEAPAPDDAPAVAVEEAEPADDELREAELQGEGFDEMETRAGNSVRAKAEKVEDSVPGFVKNFGFSMYRLDWLKGDNPGVVNPGSDEFLFEPYGYAMVGSGRSINLGVPSDAGISTFFTHDSASGVSAAGKIPNVEDVDAAGKAIMGVAKRMQHGRMGTTLEKSRFTALRKKIEKGMSPHEYEMERFMREFGQLEISPGRLLAGLVFLAGRLENGSFGVPPAQVLPMLSAMHAVGIELCTLKMYRWPEKAVAPMFYSPEKGLVSAGTKKLIAIDQKGRGSIADLIQLHDRFTTAMDEMDVDGVSADKIATYHLPVAVGRWWGRWDEFNTRLYKLVDDVTLLSPSKRKGFLLETYRNWHKGLPSVAAGGVKSGSGRGGGRKAAKPSGKGGGGKGFRGIARSRAPGKTEKPEALIAAHNEEDGVAAAIISGAAISTGVLPLIARAGAVVI